MQEEESPRCALPSRAEELQDPREHHLLLLPLPSARKVEETKSWMDRDVDVTGTAIPTSLVMNGPRSHTSTETPALRRYRRVKS